MNSAAAPPTAASRRRPAILPLLAVTAGVAVLCALGTWQLQRLQWKTRMLQRIAALQTAPPEPLSVVLNRIADRVDVDFTHVVFTCPSLETTPVVRIYSVTDAGVGDRIVTACPLPPGQAYRTILVDRGFLPEEASSGYRPAGGPVDSPVVGVLRAPGRPASPAAAPSGGRFYSRDVAVLAAALGAEAPAPVFFMLESPAPAAGPRPAPVPVDIPNNHLGYAVTWFGLAVSLIGVYLASQFRRLKA